MVLRVRFYDTDKKAEITVKGKQASRARVGLCLLLLRFETARQAAGMHSSPEESGATEPAAL